MDNKFNMLETDQNPKGIFVQKKSYDFDQLENDYYESKPYIFAFSSLLCFVNKASANGQLTSNLLTVSSILFAVSAASIFYYRFFFRYYR
jgi:hypothetical protein